MKGGQQNTNLHISNLKNSKFDHFGCFGGSMGVSQNRHSGTKISIFSQNLAKNVKKLEFLSVFR